MNISTVFGKFAENFSQEIQGAYTSQIDDESRYNGKFWASGLSLVAHMNSPFIPAIHMNTRFIIILNPETHSSGTQNNFTSSQLRCDEKLGALCSSLTKLRSDDVKSKMGIGITSKSWFGGGIDLTPTFSIEADNKFFHTSLMEVCNKFDKDYYPKFKKACDEYFFLSHRNESRGVGGIFFDYLNTGDWNKDFDFIKAVGASLAPIFKSIIENNINKSWSQEDKERQFYKRGRYAEFNLLYDRGTRFGLMTGGNIEAILMSMPPQVKWV